MQLAKVVDRNCMTLFEVMTALSATFAIGIPTFMEKVMRPKYEERFSEFRDARRDEFIDEFEKALQQLKQSKKEMTPETIETMESLFNEWGQVKADENRLTSLLKYRKFFFIGWFLSCALSLFSIQYFESIIYQNSNVTLGQFSIVFFCIMFAATVWYGYELFVLDDKLSKTKSKTTGEVFGQIRNIRSSLETYHEAEQKVEEVLKKFGFPYSKELEIEAKDYRTMVDFAIPRDAPPKYVIEVKAKLATSVALYHLARRYMELKEKIRVTTILVSDFSKVEPVQMRVAQKGFDHIVDFQNLEKLKDIIKL